MFLFFIIIQRYCYLSNFWNCSIDNLLLYNKKFNRKYYHFLFQLFDNIFYTEINYENDLIVFLQSPHFFQCKQTLNERMAATTILIVYIYFFIFAFSSSIMSHITFLSRFDFFFKILLSRQFCCRYLYYLIQNSIIKIHC